MNVKIENELGISLHIDTIRNRAHEARLLDQIARRKPYVNKINRGKRLKFAQEMPEKLLNFWESVIWSDEPKFNLFGSDGKVMVWRTPREEFDPKCTVPTVKHGGGLVMVWAVSLAESLENCVFLIVSWIDSTTETFWNKIFDHKSIILNSGNNTTSCMIMILNIPLG